MIVVFLTTNNSSSEPGEGKGIDGRSIANDLDIENIETNSKLKAK
ncbi:hypothetical protein D049_4805 [Vibrio parahaemolyticus VPTS-2010]|nr:hypothetical protein D049_4805 [Vibrio parahaemolyticus VPTS-2010]